MNINAILASMSKFQATKATHNVNFTGFEKVAQNTGNTISEAAANAAGKLGIADQITKILSFVLKGLKNLGQGILRGLKKLFNANTISTNINIGKNKNTYVVNGKKVSAEEFGNTYNDFYAKLENITKDSGIVQKDGKTYIYGKLYKPEYKLPEGIVVRKNSLSITTKKPMAEFMEELKKLSEEWE